MSRFLATILILSIAWYRPLAADSAVVLETAFETDVKPFLNRHCVPCHNPDKLKSGVRVDHLDAKLGDSQIRLWESIAKQLTTRVMPPDDEPQPSAMERERAVEWIHQGLTVARSRPTPKNGSVRRLTTSQYRNTLRDLLLLDDNLSETLPPDAVSRDGFSNHQETLQLSPLLLEAYYDLADAALNRCIVDPSSKPVIQNFRMDLGASINPNPCKDDLILGADSLLLKNEDFVVHELTPLKPFSYDPFLMQTKFRFIEGYKGNDTVRGWREYDSIYHAVFACMRGSHGYPKGDAYSTVPRGLLLRPAIPSTELFGVDSTYGPKANFKISLRELPDHGNFRITVTASKYDDGLLLDANNPKAPSDSERSITCRELQAIQTIKIDQPGIYQVDVYVKATNDVPVSTSPKPNEESKRLVLTLGARQFSGTPSVAQPAFLAVRLPAGSLPILAAYADSNRLDRIVLTRLPSGHQVARRFEAFEKRSPSLGVHLGLRRDCGSTFSPAGEPQLVSERHPTQFRFEGAIRNFPSPDVEKDNVTYLAGVREIGVRSEYTDGRDMPRLLISSVEFEGPYFESWPPPAHRNLFIDSKHSQDPTRYAREILQRFATRAYRRPTTSEEDSALVKVFEASYQRTRKFEAAIKDALQVALTSPQFLFLIENSPAPTPEPLEPFELASKLSYFLWNGPPDSSLLQLAASGALRPQLDATVDRMIHDPRFSLFIEEFASQWLALDKFQVLEPDRAQFPKLTRDTRAQLRREPLEFLKHLFRNNLPARHLIDSDIVLANEVVAAYYEMAVKTDSGFQFVALPRVSEKLGGFLTQAAILAGLSDGRESNPIKRGAWFARRIIAEPPDDPPPNVPALKEESKNLPLRARLEQHRNQTGCAQCHSKIDPWGVAFEEFDAGGRLKTSTVDARSILPDKTEVSGMTALKRYLANDRLDQVSFSLLKHLAIYATGRSLSYNETEFLKRQNTTLKSGEYRLRDMIQLLVHSPVFLEK